MKRIRLTAECTDADSLACGALSVLFLQQRGSGTAAHSRQAGDDEAKFWLAPVQLAANYGFNSRELTQIEEIIREHRDSLLEIWNDYFGA